MKYRKKPVIVDAVLWTGKNFAECINFCPPLLSETYRGDERLTIPTLEGKMTAETGDYIIKGIKGEFYPCKPDIFKQTYDPVESNQEDKDNR